MGSEEAVNSLSSVSETDDGKLDNGLGGASYSKYQPNACLLGNEAQNGVEVAGHTCNGFLNCSISESQGIIQLSDIRLGN
jgi:hypothetical protein